MPVINKPVVNMGNAAVTEFVDTVNTTDTTYTFLESDLRDYFKIENVGTYDLVVTVAGSSYTLKQGEKKELNTSYPSFSVRAATNTAAFRVRASYFIYDELDEQNISRIKKEVFKESVIEVGAGKGFTTVTDAINSIVNNASDKRYRIKVYAGNYAERIVLKPYVGIEGINKEAVIFEWDRPLTTPDADVTSQSMVEAHEDGCFLKNITVKGSNFRYMIHTEFGTNIDRSVEIDNVYAEHKGNDASYSWQLPHAYGAGLGVANTKITIKNNSRLIGAVNGRGLLIHDNSAPTAPSFVDIDDSIMLSNGGSVYGGVNLDNYSPNKGSVPWYVSFNNCYIQAAIDVTTTSNPQRCRISGGGNSMQTYFAADWVDSTAGYVIKNVSGATISNGTAVMMHDNKRQIASVMNGTSYNNYSRFLGFAVEDIPDGSYGRVCYKGSIYALFNSTSNYLDELMLDTNGQVIKYDSSTAGRRPVIGQQVQAASATVGSRRYIHLRDNVRDVVAGNVLTRGSNFKKVASNGYPTIAPDYLGQFWQDTGTSAAVYIGIDTAQTGSSGWYKVGV